MGQRSANTRDPHALPRRPQPAGSRVPLRQATRGGRVVWGELGGGGWLTVICFHVGPASPDGKGGSKNADSDALAKLGTGSREASCRCSRRAMRPSKGSLAVSRTRIFPSASEGPPARGRGPLPHTADTQRGIRDEHQTANAGRMEPAGTHRGMCGAPMNKRSHLERERMRCKKRTTELTWRRRTWTLA